VAQTADQVRQVQLAFDTSAEKTVVTGRSTLQAQDRAQSLLRQADALNKPGVAFTSALIAADELGEAFGICRAIDAEEMLDAITGRLASLFSNTLFADPTEGPKRCTAMHYELAERQLARGRKSDAAISLTNGALSVIQSSYASKDEVSDALKTLERALRMREKNTVDVGYSLFNIAIAQKRQAAFSLEPDKSRIFSIALKNLDRANAIFRKFNATVPKALYYENVLECLSAWLAYEQKLQQSLLDRRAWEDVDKDGLFTSADAVSSMLRSNPQVFGLDETPDWIPDLKTVTERAVAKIPKFRQKIDQAEKFLARSTKSNPGLRLKIFGVRSMLTSIDGYFPPPFDALDEIWKSQDYKLFFDEAKGIVTWEENTRLPKAEYTVLLIRIVHCVRQFRTEWKNPQIERLLLGNPLTFRVAACELARLKSWYEAYELLELTRGLTSSRNLRLEPAPEAQDDISWVHLTHSPNGTYAICSSNGSVTGATFPGLPGRELVAQFLAWMGGSLLMDQESNRYDAALSARRIETLFGPVADWVRENSNFRTALIPGGLFQAFPFWTCGSLRESMLNGEKQVTTVPSRFVAYLNNKRQRLSQHRISVQEASSTNAGVLRWSAQEGQAISRIVSHTGRQVVEDSASHQSILTALKQEQIVHFTGHSRAEMDPHDSHLVTYGAPLTVHDILEFNSVESSLVVLGSCQSGLSRDAMHPDEMLSIQSAIYYAGATTVIGTSWPIRDYVGFAFTAQFYESLQLEKLDDSSSVVDAVSSAYVSAINWMIGASTSQLNALLKQNGAEEVSRPEDGAAFDYYDWAAFGVIGVAIPPTG